MKYKTVHKLKDNMLLSCKVLSSSRILLRSGAFLGSCALLGSCAHSDKELPLNIVLINLDDAGNGDFSFKGAVGYQTPHIDKLAAEGVSMTNFYAVQPISGASRAGLMTGCYPNRIGFAYAPNPNSPTGISDKEETIAELLKTKGYATAIFGNGIWEMPGNSCHSSMVSMNIMDYPTPMICGPITPNINFPICL